MGYPNVRLTRVLQLINRAREACGLETLDSIPRGNRRSNCGCPLAKAFHELGPAIDVGKWHLYGVAPENAELLARAFRTSYAATNTKSSSVQLPPLLQKFILNFDGGAYDKLALKTG